MTASETSAAAFTVKVAEPLMLLCVAVTALLPCVRLVAKPVALMVATAVFDEAHVAALLRFWVVPSL